MKKKQLLFILFALILTVSSYGQKVIYFPELDVIVHNTEKKNFDFYKKTEDNQYQKILLSVKHLIKNQKPFRISKTKETLADLQCKNCRVIKTQNLKEQEESVYLNTINTLHTGVSFVSKNNVPSDDYVFASINSSLFFLRNVFGYYKTKAGIKGEILPTEFQRTFYYQKLVLKIAENKHVTLLISDDTIVGYYIEFKDKNELVLKFRTVKNCIDLTKVKNKNLTRFDTYFLTSDSFVMKDFFMSQKDSLKYRLLDNLGYDILKKTFDTIKFSSDCAIAILKDTTYLINKKFENHSITNVKKIYPRFNGFEILTDKKAYNLHNSWTEINSLSRKIDPLCGTVYTKHHHIKKSDKKKFKYKIEIETGIVYPNEKEIAYLRGIPENDSISFLNGTKKHYRDGNSSFRGIKKGFPNKLLVYKNGKVGLFEYNPKKRYKFPVKKPKKVNGIVVIPNLDLNLKWYTKVKKVLPINNTKIQYNKYEGIIKIFNQNKVEFLFKNNPRTYSKVTQKTASFYEVEKNGRKGFLDVLENKEYGFKR